jgi:hypothetical protein
LKRSKKILIGLFIVGLIIFCALLYPGFNGTNRPINYLHYLVWGNNLKVSVAESLDKNKVKIVFENEMAMIQKRNIIRNPKEADFLVRHTRYKVIRETIYENGKQMADIPYDYGKLRLVIYYNGKEIGELGHWQTNFYYVHTYTIRVEPSDNGIVVKTSMEGPDADFYKSRNEK